MRALLILVFVLAFHGEVCYPWMPVTQDDGWRAATEAAKQTNVTTAAPATKCRTARSASGECVRREHCDFGPGAVDFTLYAPRGYKKPCKVDEVCCPYQFILAQSEPADDDFDVDDDDF